MFGFKCKVILPFSFCVYYETISISNKYSSTKQTKLSDKVKKKPQPQNEHVVGVVGQAQRQHHGRGRWSHHSHWLVKVNQPNQSHEIKIQGVH